VSLGRVKTVNQVTQARTAVKAESIPKPRIFMMGNGKPVQPSASKNFCEQAVMGSLSQNNEMRAWFQIGMAAAVDMISTGTFDFSTSADTVIDSAWSDINNITIKPNKVTDIMRIEIEL